MDMMGEITVDTVIWRYMSFESFMSLLSDKSISFCRYDKLKNIDPYECAKSKYELEQQKFNINMLSQIGSINWNLLLGNANLLNKEIKYCEDELDKRYYISCWHINNYESVAMWDSFTNTKTGIAIKTTIGELKNALISNNYSFNFEPVIYDDLSNSKSEIKKIIRKTKYFVHENELRVYFEYIDKMEQESYKYNADGNISGSRMVLHNPERIPVTININELIDEIVVSPKSEEWFLRLITNILKDYKISIIPKNSDIKVNNLILNNKYELISETDELIKFIDNSSFGLEARQAQYRMVYDKENGNITGCFPTNIDYIEIPEPYVFTSWEVWQRWCKNNNSIKVDTNNGEIIEC